MSRFFINSLFHVLKWKETPLFLLFVDFGILHLQDRLADLIIFDRMHGKEIDFTRCRVISPSKNTGINLIKSMKYHHT